MAEQRNKKYSKKKVVRKQPRKDNQQKRVNFDNTRATRFERDVEKMEKDHSNDVAWYSRNPELLRAAGSVAFSDVVGQQLPFQSDYSTSVPGVLAIPWSPTYGGFGMNAINQAKQDLYSFVVHANSRNQSYDPNDLMITILAAKDVFNAIGAMIRVYGTMKKFSGINMYTPRALVSAMGFKYDDLVSNLANMWFDINELVARSSQLWIPNTIPLIARQFWMNSNVYYDANSPKAQYYLYVQCQYYTLKETDFEDGGSLREVATSNLAGTGESVFRPGYRGNTYTWKQWKEAINTMFANLLDSQDRGIMLGDVLKAFGPDKIYSLSEIPSSYNIDYTYNPEVLSQIENLVVTGYPMPGGLKQNLTDNTLVEYIIETAGTTSNSFGDSTAWQAPKHVIMNFHGGNQPTPEQIMVASRMMVANPTWVKENAYYVNQGKLTPATSAFYSFQPQYSGTEIARTVVIWYYKYSGTTMTLAHYDMEQNEAAGAIDTDYLALWTAFDWAPWYYTKAITQFTATDASAVGLGTTEALSAYGDYDVYCVIDSDILRKLHTTAVYSEFGVPIMG